MMLFKQGVPIYLSGRLSIEMDGSNQSCPNKNLAIYLYRLGSIVLRKESSTNEEGYFYLSFSSSETAELIGSYQIEIAILEENQQVISDPIEITIKESAYGCF